METIGVKGKKMCLPYNRSIGMTKKIDIWHNIFSQLIGKNILHDRFLTSMTALVADSHYLSKVFCYVHMIKGNLGLSIPVVPAIWWKLL